MEKGDLLWGDLLLSTPTPPTFIPFSEPTPPTFVPFSEPTPPTFVPFSDYPDQDCHQTEKEREKEKEKEKEKEREEKEEIKRKIESNTIKTIIVRNLPRDITVHILRDIFEKYGPIKDIYIPKNMDRLSPYYGTIKGFALIKFLTPQHSALAFYQLSSLVINHNRVALEFAKQDR
jgi:RNA recognition motif-containing protein